MSFWDRIKLALGGPPKPRKAVAPQHLPADPHSAPASEEDAFAQSAAARDAFWSRLGTVETDVLGHLISPTLMGGPAWPTTRQAYRVIRRPTGTVIIATDGLSDPFSENAPGNGFGMELFIETGAIDPEHLGTPGSISGLSKSWAFEVLSHSAGTVADAGGITGQLDQYGALSMELPGVSQSHSIGAQVPAHYVTPDDALGVMLGVPPDFATDVPDMPLSPVRMVAVTVITAAELEAVRAGGAETRKALVAELAARGTHHRSALQ